MLFWQERVGQLLRAWPICGVLREATLDQGRELYGQVPTHLREWIRRIAHVLRDDAHWSRRDEDRTPRQQFVGHAAQRIHVRCRDRRFAGGHLRAHVARGSQRLPLLRELLVRWDFGAAGRDAEIDHDYSPAVVLEQDVRRFDVTMHESPGVCRSERARHLRNDALNVWSGHLHVFRKRRLERATGDVLHHEIRGAARGQFANPEDRHHMRMLDGGRSLCLTNEAGMGHHITGERRRQQLDRDLPFERRFPTQQHCTHSAYPKHTLDQDVRGKRR